MTGHFPQFEQLLLDLKPYWQHYLPEKTEQAFQKAQEKINAERLSIQVYGAYNAGKSTLINVLLAQTQAPMAEVPTTDKIERYPWQGYDLLDSPGINAPIEHEQISLDSLKQNDLVLMVIRQDDHDSKDVYERLFACIENGKQVFIVFNYNDLDPHQSGEGSVSLLVHHIYELLLEMAQARGISAQDLQQQVKVLPMQLASALKARLAGNKPLLLERSGYQAFICEFEAWIEAYDNETDFLRSVHTYLQNTIIQPLLEQFAIHKGEASQRQVVLHELQALALQKNNLITMMRYQVKSVVQAEKPAIAQAVESAQNEQDLQAAISPILNRVHQSLNESLQKVADDACLSLDNSYVRMDNPMIIDNTAESENGQIVIKIGLEGLQSINNPENVKTALLQLRRLKVPFIKGRWEKTLGSWAGKAVPFLQIGISLIETLHSNYAQSKENKQKMAAALQLSQFVSHLCQNMIDEMTTDIIVLIESFFEPSISEQTEKLNSLDKESDRLKQDYEEIQEVIKTF